MNPGDVITAATLKLTRFATQGVNFLGPTWKSDAGIGPSKVLFDAAVQFGTSPTLQSSDYEDKPDVSDVGPYPTLTSSNLLLPLNAKGLNFLTTNRAAQFRVKLSPLTFTNRNGV